MPSSYPPVPEPATTTSTTPCGQMLLEPIAREIRSADKHCMQGPPGHIHDNPHVASPRPPRSPSIHLHIHSSALAHPSKLYPPPRATPIVHHRLHGPSPRRPSAWRQSDRFPVTTARDGLMKERVRCCTGICGDFQSSNPTCHQPKAKLPFVERRAVQ